MIPEKAAKFNWIKIFEAPPDPTALMGGLEIKVVHVNGREICLTLFNNTFYSFERRCPHAGAFLDQGWLNDNGEVVCSHHHYRFDPATGENVSGEGCFLQTYPVISNEEGIFIGFEKRSWFSRLFG